MCCCKSYLIDSENETGLNSHFINKFLECPDVGSVVFHSFPSQVPRIPASSDSGFFSEFIILCLTLHAVIVLLSLARDRCWWRQWSPSPQKTVIGDGERSRRRRDIVPKETHCEEREPESHRSKFNIRYLSDVKQAFACMMHAQTPSPGRCPEREPGPL